MSVLRLFICAAMQILFVGMYGMWAILRPDSARGTLPIFISVVWVLVVYNNWRPIRDAISHVRSR